jgi:hypothetical protein
LSSDIVRQTQFTIDAISWTPIYVPFDCNHISITTGDTSNALKLRTAAGDPTSEVTIGSTQQWTIGTQPAYRFPRFLTTEPVLYAQAAAGTGPLVLMAHR